VAEKQQFQPPSTEFLMRMGYRFSRTLLNHDNLCPENYLWRAVVVNALEDCMIVRGDRKSSTFKQSAHNWIITNCKDFDMVCNWAMLDPDDVIAAYKNALKQKNIKFTIKHVMWSKYNSLSRCSNREPESRRKRLLKCEMKKIRSKVKETSNYFVSTVFINVVA
jgi:hypothetical protein